MKDFPILERKVNGKSLVYLDSAATSLTPKQVVSAMNDYYENYNANINRGIHQLGEEATEMYELARKKIARFVNSEELIFTKSTTDTLNILAHALSQGLDKKDNVVLTEMEHHSNLVPWQQMAKKGFELRFAPVNDGVLDIDAMQQLVDDKTAVVSVVHASNFLGTINPVNEIAKIAHDNDALVVLDAAQSVPHMPVDMKKLGADFIAFSGHKMMGPTGIGALCASKELLEKLPPVMFGGGMIKSVSYKETSFADIPDRFEPGTPNIAGAVGFGAAVDYLKSYGMEKVEKHNHSLANSTMDLLSDIGADVYGPAERTGLVSFNLPGMHAHDVSTLLDEKGIAIRAGHHCVMPLHDKMGLTASCRASFHIYNKDSELDALKEALLSAKEVFK
ncbi:aminotransferase class V-fold PLP-dependent enzyme [Nanoarchaeota archaeon]